MECGNGHKHGHQHEVWEWALAWAGCAGMGTSMAWAWQRACLPRAAAPAWAGGVGTGTDIGMGTGTSMGCWHQDHGTFEWTLARGMFVGGMGMGMACAWEWGMRMGHGMLAGRCGEPGGARGSVSFPKEQQTPVTMGMMVSPFWPLWGLFLAWIRPGCSPGSASYCEVWASDLWVLPHFQTQGRDGASHHTRPGPASLQPLL